MVSTTSRTQPPASTDTAEEDYAQSIISAEQRGCPAAVIKEDLFARQRQLTRRDRESDTPQEVTEKTEEKADQKGHEQQIQCAQEHEIVQHRQLDTRQWLRVKFAGYAQY